MICTKYPYWILYPPYCSYADNGRIENNFCSVGTPWSNSHTSNILTTNFACLPCCLSSELHFRLNFSEGLFCFFCLLDNSVIRLYSHRCIRVLLYWYASPLLSFVVRRSTRLGHQTHYPSKPVLLHQRIADSSPSRLSRQREWPGRRSRTSLPIWLICMFQFFRDDCTTHPDVVVSAKSNHAVVVSRVKIKPFFISDLEAS